MERWQIHKYVTILPCLSQGEIVAIELGIALQNHSHLSIRREKNFQASLVIYVSQKLSLLFCFADA